LLEAPDGMLQLTEADGGGSDDESAVRDGFGEGLEFFGAGKHRRGADCGSRLAERQFIGVYYAQMEEAEVAHGPGGGTDVKGIARTDEYDAQAAEFGVGRQGRRVYSRTVVMKQKEKRKRKMPPGRRRYASRRLARAARGNIDCGRVETKAC
jgi:hypothetical protein